MIVYATFPWTPRVFLPWVPGDTFFLIDTDLIVPGRSRVNEARSAERKEREPYQTVAGALLNHKHGLFHIRYFENGPPEPG